MRWKVSLAVPVLSLLFLATDSNAQGVPVTVTFPAAQSPVDSIQFTNVAQGQTFKPDPQGRQIQHFVGLLSSSNNRYDISAISFVGGSTHADGVSIAAQATCKDVNDADFSEGKVVRIACSIVRHGKGLVCTAVYDKMSKPAKPYCVGTIACKKCAQIKVCGSHPEC